MSSAARAFEQRSAAAVAHVIAEIDNAGAAADSASTSSTPSIDAVGRLDFRAAQIEKDAKLAEELQREEYRKEEARTQRQRQRRAAAAQQNSSWAEWIMGTSTSTPANTPSNTTSSSPARSSASSTGGAARVAQPSGSIFACVAQSIGSVMGPTQGQVSGVDASSLL
mmetsp:Transcript_8527/g.25259  ORF Transcript_8527/g.25259 Transcript_8527/m.25259 type:complete len:167 (-) Transcript_8527:353-853(-)|eukprot:CAMPEP_0172371234 /NCGR_PEP_ID=MMETSP1060-20121228/41824_1 /TAXON_ID=37318 /ORGANISM="Pseudo-nitzschia pungens, Strain cf. cingulata" /LENGTH=166 /DNA_ID=CAMNT_0013096793 /DNA_START=97 /DNA_END=597 /DNA_ORIENTATION=+